MQKAAVKRVAVIGSGAAGLQVAKSMVASGFDCIVLDKSPKVGGLWQSNYSSYGLQVPKQLYEISDFPHSKVASGYYPKGAEVQSYLENFATENDLHKLVRSGTALVKAEKKSDGTEGWILSAKDSTGHVVVEEVDYLVISTGVYSTPHRPTFDGEDVFEGEIMHSSKYTEKTMGSGKNVVVVGGAKSAIDVVVDSSSVSKRSTLVYRGAHWSAPREIAGFIPFQWIFLSRFGQGLVSWYKGAWPGAPSSVHTANKVLSPVMGGVFGIVEALIGYQLGFKGSYRPQNDIVTDFYGYGHVLDSSFKKARESNAVDTVKGSIVKLTKNTAILSCGKEIPCDLVVCATGYEKSYDYFDSEILKALNVEKDGLYLYRHCLPPNVPNLAFVGSEVATISNIATYGIMAEWLSRVMTKTMTMPSNEDMKKEVEEMKEWKRSWMPETTSRASLVLLHQTHYHDSLLRDMCISHRRKGSNWAAELFAPYQGGDYDGIFGKKKAI